MPGVTPAGDHRLKCMIEGVESGLFCPPGRSK